MFDLTDAIVHVLLVAFSGLVLLISLLAYVDRRTSRYFFLCLAFAFLAASEVVGLIESWFLSTSLIFIPSTGIHLSHFLEFLMLASFSLALLAKNWEEGYFLKSEGRARIKLLVSLQPGLHLRELQRQIGLSFSSTRYHVDKLAKEGEIDRVEDQGYSRIFPAGTASRDRLLLSFVRRKTDHKIISCLLREEGVSQQRLSNIAGLSKSTVSEHLANLLSLGVVRTKGGEEGRIFELTDPASVNRIMNGNPPLLKKATGRFIDLWDF